MAIVGDRHGAAISVLLVVAILTMTSFVSRSIASSLSPDEKVRDVEPVKCKTPETPINAVQQVETDMSAVEYTCRPGLTLIGSAHAVCTDDGQWTSEPPLCLGHDCPRLHVKQATMLSSHAGAMIRYLCRKGFVLDGAEVLACVGGGQWNGTKPNCRRQAGKSRMHQDATSKISAVTQPQQQDDNDEGDEGLRQRQKLTEKDRSKWSLDDWLEVADYTCIQQPEVVTPPPVANARAFTQWAVHAGRPRLYTTYQCRWGHVMSGGSGRTLYCSRGQWIGVKPSCHPLPSSEDDDETALQGDTVGSGGQLTHDQLTRRADYSCLGHNGGSGGSSASGIIDPPVPDHGLPPVLKFTIVKGRPRLFAKYTACLDGFAMNDPSTEHYMYCRDRKWIGRRPVCLPAAEVVRAAADGCLMNNGGCDQLCASGGASGLAVSCSCKVGFTLDPDNGRTCHDVDECTVNNAGCEHICENIDGGYTCRCYDGFQLNGDHVTCSAVKSATKQDED